MHKLVRRVPAVNIADLLERFVHGHKAQLLHLLPKHLMTVMCCVVRQNDQPCNNNHVSPRANGCLLTSWSQYGV